MESKGWKNKKTSTIVGTETNPTKLESGQVVINKKATKQNLDRLIEINNDGLDKPIKKEVTTDGTEGGLLKGKAHYDENGNPLGGIPAVVDGAKKIETENDEFLLNKEASQKHWKELSKINQSTGNGVPINPSDVGVDEDPKEFKDGGVIEFNPNKIPSRAIYAFAKKVKQKYPKVWDMGGNIFGNEAFNNLERVIKRGYWTESEEWMYIKWRSYVARHHKDFRIAGTIAMLKWVDKTDKGWPYMKDLIEKEIAKKYPKKGWKNKMAEGGGVEFMPQQGTLLTKDKKIKLDYKKNGNNFEFVVYEGETNPVANYTKTSFKKKENGVVTMDYNQFINYIYAEGYIDDKNYDLGGGVEFVPEKKGTLIRGNEIIKYFEKVNGNYRLIFYTLNETKVPTMCDAFGYCKELNSENLTPKQLVELIKKNNLMEHGGGVGEGIKSEQNDVELVSVQYLNSIRSQDKSRFDYDLEKSIEKNGIKEPVTIAYWPEYDYVTLIDGHHRLDTAIDLGLEKIPTKIQIMHDNPIGKIKVHNIETFNENAKKPSDLEIFKDGGNVEDEKKKLKLEILKLTSKAFKQFSGSPNQKKTMDEISKLREQLDKIDGKFEDGGAASWDKLAVASSRFRPVETIVFDPPLIGENGTKLLSYTWAYEMTMQPNREGELVGKRVSDWTQADISAETGRGIVHKYTLELPDGSIRNVSSESVPILLGYIDRSQVKVFGNLATASKTLAKQQMVLALMEAKNKEYEELRDKFKKAEKPQIELAEISDLPLITQYVYEREFEEGKGVSFTPFKMGDVIYRQENEYNYSQGKYLITEKPNKYTIEQLTSEWIGKRVEKAGGVNPRGLYDLKNRVARQKRKVEQMLKTPSMEDGGTTDDFDWESLFNPSPEEEEKIKQEIKKSEEQEKEDWYQGTKFSKEWAATYKDAINKTVKEYLDAKATYEDWGSRQYKSNKGVVYAGGDDIHGTAYTIGGINEYRRKKTMAGAKMLMDESIETLKDLRLTDEEISNLLNNKMAKGGITENHEDLETQIMKQQFGR